MISYPIADSGQFLIFEDNVISHFERYRQNELNKKEAGGQLFAKFIDKHVIVTMATGPNKNANRGRLFFFPNRLAENLEIKHFYKKGLHFIGDWHTHPQKIPSPSYLDYSSINECFLKSKHDLGEFLLVIVGTKNAPKGIHVSIHNGKRHLTLEAQ